MTRTLALTLPWAAMLALTATPAEAGGIVAAIGAFFASGSIVVQVIGRILVSIAASALMRALAPKPRTPGIRTEVTQNGGVNPCSFILMRYATAGQRVCPPMSHGSSGDTPNAYLTEVIELGDIPGQALHRVMINDQYVTLGATAHPDYGFPVLGELNGVAWVKYYDGTQTDADPMLLAKYGSYPERPWTSDMIGRGLCYAILTCKFSRKKWNAMPRFRFEVGGIPLYDPRKDSTVGGSGPHRWNDKATWEPTTNPVVAIYNILRGIALPDGSVWGGGIPAVDLPLGSWFAAMNECDVLVGDGLSGTEPQYRAGFEVGVDEEPADIIDELLKACSGQISEVGGIWKIRVGGPGVPVLSITDGDILTSSPEDLTPFPGFTASFNGIHATYPEPAMLWEPKEAPPLYNPAWEEADQGQRLVANLGLPAVPYGVQVRRLMAAYIAEERRFLRHGQSLPPDAAVLEPLDAISWTSAQNGYSAKVFEVSEVADDLWTCRQTVALRERDPADYVSSNPAPPEVPSLAVVIPSARVVPGFSVTGTSITDATAAPRRPALKLSWEPDLPDVRAIAYEVRLTATGVVVASGSTDNVAAGELVVSEGILADTAYQARVLPVLDFDADWTDWVGATSPITLITSSDLAFGAVTDQLLSFLQWPTGSAAAFSAISNNSNINQLDVGAPDSFWIVTAGFEISRTAGSGGAFNVQFQEERYIGAFGGGSVTLHTWNVMTDGEPSGPPGPDPDGGGWWPRWHVVIRGGAFSLLRYRLFVTKTSNPTGKIRNVQIRASRIIR